MSAPVPNALSVRGLSKTFGGQRALSNVDLDVMSGEVHALLGENGSGKSTLVKCLSGYHQPDPGARIEVGGEVLPPTYGPESATSYGLAFVHQDLGLIPTLTVAENMLLGQSPPTGFGWRAKKRQEAALARRQLTALDHPDIDPRRFVGELSVAQQTIVALARALYGAERGKLLVLDEPTASLAQSEVERLFEAVRRITEEGHGVIYISHKLDEVRALARTVTVLRNGEKVGTRTVAELSRAGLIEMIVGRPLEALYPSGSPAPHTEPVLTARGISGRRVKNLSMTLHKGEIVGVAGLLGCGKSELGRLLFGDQRLTGGEVRIEEREVRLRAPADAIGAGISMVPADRHRNGVILDHSVGENMTLLETRRYWRRGLMRRRERARTVRALMEEYDVRPRQPSRLIGLLSGGNQQKAVLAKWMHRDLKVLILDEPTQGVDIGAKAQILAQLERVATRGVAVLFISEEVDDLVHLCDRIVVLADGEVAGEVSAENKTRNRISELAYQEEVVS
ncbi:MAG: sugar ABC transporter ATP-binding protein [Actinobacteria bacterium]|nr:sugar ABC transporter ATP-binding protein [Actinomycetota bacterium]